jgi:predicted ribosomally synthesized peptide with nif11-like leader
MSKAQVAAFIKTIAERPELNSRVAAIERTPAAWVEVAKSLGVEISIEDFVAFVSDVTGKPADAGNAVHVLLSTSDELADSELEQVAGGAGPQPTAPTKITLPKPISDALSKKKNYIVPCV